MRTSCSPSSRAGIGRTWCSSSKGLGASDPNQLLDQQGRHAPDLMAILYHSLYTIDKSGPVS